MCIVFKFMWTDFLTICTCFCNWIKETRDVTVLQKRAVTDLAAVLEILLMTVHYRGALPTPPHPFVFTKVVSSIQ